MYERIRTRVLQILRVPPQPHPPAGDPASLRVFRAGKNFYFLRLFRWGLGQSLALAGLVFWVVVLVDVQEEAQRRRAVQPQTAGTLMPGTDVVSGATAEAEPGPVERKTRSVRERRGRWDQFHESLVRVALNTPPWASSLFWLLKVAGIAGYLAQLPPTFAIVRIDFEMRWYIVTDRSLRLRSGVVKVQEVTMSFANLQQVEVHQGPLQRLLGLADVQVRSAGGGDAATKETGRDSMHLARFHGVTNAAEIRDLILDRLRRFRDSGLGDPDDRHDDAPAAPVAVDTATLVAAARELAAEARALRTPS